MYENETELHNALLWNAILVLSDIVWHAACLHNDKRWSLSRVFYITYGDCPWRTQLICHQRTYVTTPEGHTKHDGIVKVSIVIMPSLTESDTQNHKIKNLSIKHKVQIPIIRCTHKAQ